MSANNFKTFYMYVWNFSPDCDKIKRKNTREKYYGKNLFANVFFYGRHDERQPWELKTCSRDGIWRCRTVRTASGDPGRRTEITSWRISSGTDLNACADFRYGRTAHSSCQCSWHEIHWDRNGNDAQWWRSSCICRQIKSSRKSMRRKRADFNLSQPHTGISSMRR